MIIGFDAKRAINNRTGLGNYSRFIIDLVKENNPNIEVKLFGIQNSKSLLSDKNLQIFGPQKSIFNFIWRSFTIKSDLKKQGVNVYHGLSNEIPLGLKNSGIKTVVTIHDLIFMRFPQYYGFIDRLIYTLKVKYACKNSDAIIAISQKTKDDIIELLGINADKIHVVYQNCDDKFGVFSEQNIDVKTKFGLQNRYMICVGSIEPRKNQLNLVKAFEKANINELDLVIVGNGKKYKNELLTYIESQKLKNIKVLSGIDNKDLIPLYQHAESAAYVSEYEGFGIPILEAFKAGLPVLVATGSCLEEAGGLGGIYSKPQDIESLKEGIVKLFNDTELRNQLRKKGKQQLSLFHNDVILSQLSSLYLSIL